MTPEAITFVDTTLRDGDHALDHQISEQLVDTVAARLAAANVPIVEVGHGAGLGGSSVLWGRATVDDRLLLAAARRAIGDGESKLMAVLVPGLGTLDQVDAVAEARVDVVRVATHCTEADLAIEHIGALRERGIRAGGFLQMAHAIPPAELAEQAAIMADAGAEVVWIADTAGTMLRDDVRARVATVGERVGCELGLHMHNNLGVAVSNTLAGVEEGATWVDGSLAALGAGAGNAPTEVLAVVFERLGMATGMDAAILLEAAETLVRPAMSMPQIIDRDSVVAGIAGVYASVLHAAKAFGARYGVETSDVLVEAGRRGVVVGQDDMIEDLALKLRERVGR